MPGGLTGVVPVSLLLMLGGDTDSGNVLAMGLERFCPVLCLSGHGRATPQPKKQPQLQRDRNPVHPKRARKESQSLQIRRCRV